MTLKEKLKKDIETLTKLLKKDISMQIINSYETALDYWHNEFGEPEYMSAYNDLVDADNKLNEFKQEDAKLKNEIKSRSIEYLNQFKINRSIELYFLIKSGDNYLIDCMVVADKVEESVEPLFNDLPEFDDYRDPFREDSLFPHNYED